MVELTKYQEEELKLIMGKKHKGEYLTQSEKESLALVDSLLESVKRKCLNGEWRNLTPSESFAVRLTSNVTPPI